MIKEISYTTTDQQIEKLISQGLFIENKESVSYNLKIYGYYNIINSYKEPYISTKINGEKAYTNGTTFEQILSLYQLDHALRNSIMVAMLDLEEHLRAIASDVIAENFGIDSNAYLKFNNYRDRYVKDPRFTLRSILKLLRDEAERSNKSPVKYYREVYHTVPPWVLFKNIFLSTLVNFVRLFKEKQKHELTSRMYGVPEHLAQMPAIANLLIDTLFVCLEYRNLAAHGGRVYNYLPKSKTRLAHESSQCLEELINGFSTLKDNYGLSSLLFLLNLFQYKKPFYTISSTLTQEINRHCQIYPQDIPILAKITGTEITEAHNVWISNSSKKYHFNPFCSGLSNQISISIDSAKEKGYTPCKRCCK